MLKLISQPKFDYLKMLGMTGVPTDAEVEMYLEVNRIGLRHGPPAASIMDFSRGLPWSAKHRTLLAEFSKEMVDFMREKALATAMVMHSPLMRGALTAVNWVAKPSYPMKAFKGRLETYPWLREHLERQQLPCPAETEFKVAADPTTWEEWELVPGQGMVSTASGQVRTLSDIEALVKKDAAAYAELRARQAQQVG